MSINKFEIEDKLQEAWDNGDYVKASALAGMLAVCDEDDEIKC